MDSENIDIENEAPLLYAIGKSNPFTVPEEYFKNSNADILSQIFIQDFDTANGFIVPVNYFSELTDKISSSIAIEPLRAQTENLFSVPVGYFEDLTDRISEKTSFDIPVKAKTKRIGLWLSYAAAASVTLFVGIALYFNSQNQSFKGQLDQIPDQDIVNYLQLHADEGDTYTIIENFPEENLNDLNVKPENDLKQLVEEAL